MVGDIAHATWMDAILTDEEHQHVAIDSRPADGAALDVAFIAFIREELKFDTIDALVRQMDDDSARARATLAAAPGAFPKLGTIG